MNRSIFAAFLLLASLLIAPAFHARTALAAGNVVVNGQALTPEEVQSLAAVVGEVRPGHYWYDSMSGLWGYVGGPSVGQIMPGLRGAPLAANASGRSGTGTFINGRELHPIEMQKIADAYGFVLPGRFWMDAQFNAGYEGGPVQFNISRAAGGGCGSVSSLENSAGRTSMMTGFGCDGCIDISTGSGHWSNC